MLPADQTGIGTGVYNTLKALAGSVAGAVFMNQHLLKLPIPGVKLANEHAYILVWISSAGICLSGVLVSLAVRRAPVARGAADDIPATAPATA